MSYIGKTPTPAPLTSSDITNGIISLPKLTDGTDGNLISYDASGNPVAVATGSDGQVLTSTGAGSPPAFETISSSPIKKISTNSGIVTVYSGLAGGTHTLTDYKVVHTALSTSNKLAFIVNLPYSNIGEGNCGITDFKINDGSSDILTGLFYLFNGSNSIGEQSIHFQRWNHTPSSTNAITYTLKVTIYRPSGSETAAIGSAGRPADLIVMEY